MYFNSFPKILYTVDNGASYQLVTDITERIILSSSVLNNVSAYSNYVIKEGETPDHVADNFYNNAQYYFIILLTNNIIDPIMDWPLTQFELQEYCALKYENPGQVHHYETADGIVVNSNHPGAVSVSNFEYEDKINDAKRNIKILNPRLVPDFVTQFNKLLGS